MNPWDLRPWELLADQFDVTCIVTRSNVYEVDSIAIPKVRVKALSDLIPSRRVRTAGARAPFNRYIGLASHLRSADIVHSADLGPWATAQAAQQKRFGYRLVLTVWETIPFAETLRHPLSRRNRRLSLTATDLFLAATERAREALLLEGAPSDRILVSPPGIAVDRFGAGRSDGVGEYHLLVSPGRLVWEKGHQDVIRAVAALRAGLLGPDRHDVRALIVGAGPEAARLEAYARELGIREAVEFRHTVPYDQMPDVYAAASCMVLASLPTRQWEEQFGMVLVEAMSAGLPDRREHLGGNSRGCWRRSRVLHPRRLAWTRASVSGWAARPASGRAGRVFRRSSAEIFGVGSGRPDRSGLPAHSRVRNLGILGAEPHAPQERDRGVDHFRRRKGTPRARVRGLPTCDSAPERDEVATENQVCEHHRSLGCERPRGRAPGKDAVAAEKVRPRERGLAALPRRPFPYCRRPRWVPIAAGAAAACHPAVRSRRARSRSSR